jgi:hypothetical protein
MGGGALNATNTFYYLPLSKSAKSFEQTYHRIEKGTGLKRINRTIGKAHLNSAAIGAYYI